MLALLKTSLEMVLDAKVALAPSCTSTYPPFSTISVATPPEEMYIPPPEVTVVLFAVPPESLVMPPPDMVVLFAVPPELDAAGMSIPEKS